MKKKLVLKKETIANLNNDSMSNIKGGATAHCDTATCVCENTLYESCDTNGCEYLTITCNDPTFTAQGGHICAPGCFPV